jgi:hypothetical protein
MSIFILHASQLYRGRLQETFLYGERGRHASAAPVARGSVGKRLEEEYQEGRKLKRQEGSEFKVHVRRDICIEKGNSSQCLVPAAPTASLGGLQ